MALDPPELTEVAEVAAEVASAEVVAGSMAEPGVTAVVLAGVISPIAPRHAPGVGVTVYGV